MRESEKKESICVVNATSNLQKFIHVRTIDPISNNRYTFRDLTRRVNVTSIRRTYVLSFRTHFMNFNRLVNRSGAYFSLK